MIEIPFLVFMIAFTAVWLTVRISVCMHYGAVDWKREACLLLLFVDLAVILRLSFFPLETVNGHIQPLQFHYADIFPLRVNLVPLRQLLWYETTRELIANTIGNVVMFIPTGIIMPIVFPALDRFWKAIPAGILVSVATELAQLPFAVRATDIDDVILNTLGVIIGYIIYAIARALITGRERGASRP